MQCQGKLACMPSRVRPSALIHVGGELRCLGDMHTALMLHACAKSTGTQVPQQLRRLPPALGPRRTQRKARSARKHQNTLRPLMQWHGCQACRAHRLARLPGTHVRKLQRRLGRQSAAAEQRRIRRLYFAEQQRH